MSGHKVKATISKLPINSIVNVKVSATNSMETRYHKAQNYLIIWADENIDVSMHDFKKSLIRLRSVVSDVNMYRISTDCIQALNKIDDGKVFIILSGILGQRIVPEIHEMSIINSIYILCNDQTRHEQWTKDWSKIQGVFNSIKSICESLKKIARECDHNEMPMSFIPRQIIKAVTAGNLGKQHLNQLEPAYMYSMMLKDIILETVDIHPKQMDDLVKYSHKKDIFESQLIDFQNRYNQKSPVWWYTSEIFLYGMLNKVLRSLDMEGIMKMGFFIRHLHHQLVQLHQEQSANFRNEFNVYRGQGLSKHDFQKLYNTKGGVLAFNNFLSTSKEESVAMNFVQNALNKDKDIVGVVFIMKIDPSKISTSTTPYALIDDYTVIRGEKEILFTIHTIFRVIDIKQTTKNSRLWEVQLDITVENDPEIAALSKFMNENITGSGWYRVGQLMLQVGHFSQAEEFYHRLHKNTTSDNDKAHTYHKLGWCRFKLGKFKEATSSLNKSLDLYRNSLPEDHPSLAELYNDIGCVQSGIGDHSKALELLTKGLYIRDRVLSEYHLDLAESYKNLSGVYYTMSQYSKALDTFENAHKIYEKVLLPNNLDLATSYSILGQIYNSMGNYTKALEFYDKSLKIYQKVLPPHHPDIANSYSCMGGVYNDMGNYQKAMEFYEKSLKIGEKFMTSNDPDMATFYRNIGEIYNNMGNYSKAFEFYDKSLKICEKVLPPNHPDLATCYSNIGLAYNNTGNHTKALEFHENSLKLREKALVPNNLALANSYNNIGLVYSDMSNYSKALNFYGKAKKILDECLPSDHPDWATCYDNIGHVYRCTGDYTTAMKYYKKSHKIYQKILPANHPNLIPAKYVLGLVYENLKEYSKARELYQQTYEIAKLSLPPNHPNLQLYKQHYKNLKHKE